MKIVDTFPYFNETELLELRIRLLYDYIDKFIICDGNRTHNGDIKEFTLKQTLIDLNLPLDKIKVIEVDLSIYDDNPDKWIRERAQRNAAVQEIEEDDICIVSDCDEIINPTFVKYCCTVASNHPNNIIRLPLTYLHGRADLQVISTLTELPYEWISAYICLPHHLLNYTLSTIRETGSIGNIIIYPNLFITENDKTTLVGWHFSWMGSSHRLIKKYKANVHFKDIIEYSLFPNSTEKTIDYISKYKPIAGRYDCFGRFNHVLEKYPLELLPSKLFELDRVKNFLLPIQNNNIDHIYTNSNFGENWFTFPNLYSSMVKNFPSGSRFVEVGSWKGKSASFMCVEIANSQKDIEFFCVDNWKGSEEHLLNPDLDNLYDIFLENMKSVEQFYFPLKLSSVEASKRFKNNSLDFVFIDASHTYQDVKADIIAWISKIKKGGILAGHDYYPNNPSYCDVFKVVNEIFDFDKIITSEDCFIILIE